MAYFPFAHGTTSLVLGRIFGRVIGAVWICCVVSGCASGAARTANDPASIRAEALKKLSPAQIMETADQAARRGEYERAVSMYMQAIDLEPSADLWFRVGWVYATLEKKQLAAQAFAMTLEFDPRNAQAHEQLGLYYINTKKRELAAFHLKQAIEIEPGHWRSHNGLGMLADGAHDHASAIEHYTAALAIAPNSPLLLTNLGYSNYLAGDLGQAEQLYQQALAVEPGYHAATVNVGLLQARRGNYGRAVELMSGVMDQAKANNDVGYIAFQNGDLAAAESMLREAISLSPSYYETAQKTLNRVRRAREASTDRPEDFRTSRTPVPRTP